MVTSCRLQHICYQFRRDRGTGFVFFVLPRIGEVGEDSCDASCGGSLAGVDHDEELHKTVIDVARGSRLENEYFGLLVVVHMLGNRGGEYHLHL